MPARAPQRVPGAAPQIRWRVGRASLVPQVLDLASFQQEVLERGANLDAIAWRAAERARALCGAERAVVEVSMATVRSTGRGQGPGLEVAPGVPAPRPTTRDAPRSAAPPRSAATLRWTPGWTGRCAAAWGAVADDRPPGPRGREPGGDHGDLVPTPCVRRSPGGGPPARRRPGHGGGGQSVGEHRAARELPAVRERPRRQRGGAVCTGWLIHVREPQWREIAVVGLLLIGVLVMTLTALSGGAGR